MLGEHGNQRGGGPAPGPAVPEDTLGTSSPTHPRMDVPIVVPTEGESSLKGRTRPSLGGTAPQATDLAFDSEVGLKFRGHKALPGFAGLILGNETGTPCQVLRAAFSKFFFFFFPPKVKDRKEEK